MVRLLVTSKIVGLSAGALLLAAHGQGAVPVEESVPAGDRAAYAPAATATPGNADGGEARRLSELFYELQLLRQEVQELRGTVEEQSYRLERLARDQQEQYLDLDRRMQALRSGGGGSSTGGTSATAGSQSPPAGGADTPTVGTGGTPSSERESYAAAFDLMRDRRFPESIAAFQRLVTDFPNGAYTPNAFYWLGELYLAEAELENARQSFAQVINLYPDHQKVADALYKIGVVYHRLGDSERAREYLDRVRREYPQSSAAGLAQTYLAEL